NSIPFAHSLFALACFNVLAHNRDDHVKNFWFLLNARSEWILAPAYDLVFSYGPGGEQSMLVTGEGRNPGIAELQALGKKHGITNAPEILTKVRKAVVNWPRYAGLADLSHAASVDQRSPIWKFSCNRRRFDLSFSFIPKLFSHSPWRVRESTIDVMPLYSTSTNGPCWAAVKLFASVFTRTVSPGKFHCASVASLDAMAGALMRKLTSPAAEMVIPPSSAKASIAGLRVS